MASKSKRNPVARNLNKFNRPTTHADRKQQQKRGHVKHKIQLKRFIEF